MLAAAGTVYPPVESLVHQVRRWERGERFPRDWTSAYAAAYRMTEQELFGAAEPVSPAATWPAGRLTATTDSTIAEWMSSMERRNLLMGLGVAVPWPVAENCEPPPPVRPVPPTAWPTGNRPSPTMRR